MTTSPGSAFSAPTLQSCLRAGNSGAAMQLAAEGAARGLAPRDAGVLIYPGALARIANLAALAGDAATARPINRSIAQDLIGDAYDGLGNRTDAFAAHSASNLTRKAWFQPVLPALAPWCAKFGYEEN